MTVFKSLRLKTVISLLLFASIHLCFAKSIIINSMITIDKDTTLSNVILNINNSSFLIKNNASLKIENCIINGTISSKNTSLFNLLNGQLVLTNNIFNINASAISSDPANPPLYYAINISQGGVDIVGNKFTINKYYTVGLLATNHSLTSNFNIRDNKINNFHGGILLRNSNHAAILNNRFFHVSSSNIFIISSNNDLIKNNTILFPGNNNIGDAIDVYDAENISIVSNYILSGSCYSIVILRCKNIFIHLNKIIGGITYAISIIPSVDLSTFLSKLIGSDVIKNDINKNIIITNNYLSQNRYGLTGNQIDGLIVKNNIFIQRFSSITGRKFWTNNDILFKNTININWQQNFYKEAFTQQENNDNNQSLKFVIFPLHGGVVL